MIKKHRYNSGGAHVDPGGEENADRTESKKVRKAPVKGARTDRSQAAEARKAEREAKKSAAAAKKAERAEKRAQSFKKLRRALIIVACALAVLTAGAAVGGYYVTKSETNLPKISGVIEGAPAADVDLRANDIIYEVDGVSTAGKTLTESVSMIRGEAGTTVDLTIVRQGAGDYLHVTVERAKVESPTVKYEMLDDDMAYIQIVEFDDVTIDQFTDALATVKGSDMKGLILDLRGNPGGSLDAVVQIARKLLPEGMIVYTEDKAGKRTEYTCDGKTPLEVPLVVLVDMNSASASEILAGAIQDYGIGTLVGTTTFGKGIVQQIMPFTDGSAIKITISAYYTPNGRNIHGTGIEPDVECEFDGDAYYNSDTPVDNQLEKAKEVLKDLMK